MNSSVDGFTRVDSATRRSPLGSFFLPSLAQAGAPVLDIFLALPIASSISYTINHGR